VHVCPHFVLIVDNWSQERTAVNPKTITAKHCSVSQEQFFALILNCLSLKKVQQPRCTSSQLWCFMCNNGSLQYMRNQVHELHVLWNAVSLVGKN